MIWVLVGIVVGGFGALLAQSFAFIARPVDAVTLGISDSAAGAASALVRASGMGADSLLANCVAAIAAVVVPGFICYFLAEAVMAGKAARNAAATLLTLSAAASFLWLPGPRALGLLLTAIALNLFLTLAKGVALELPLAALVTLLIGRIVLTIGSGHGGYLGASVNTLSLVGGPPGLWRLALVAVAAVPPGAALLMLLRGRRRR